MVEEDHPHVSIRRQCDLLRISRSGLYSARTRRPSEKVCDMMNSIDRIYTKWPWYGSRRLTAVLRREGLVVNRKRVRRLMRIMGLQGASPRRSTSRRNPGHAVFPYLLRNVRIERPDHVWSTDITYVPLKNGFMYLTAVIDWYSRYVLSWSLSNTLDGSFCIEALDEALKQGKPEIFNTDQGVQFTSRAFVSRLKDAGVRISMDGRGRWVDNVFVERLWRTVKHENVYFYDYETAPELYRGLIKFFHYYNEQRPHQALEDRTPGEVYRQTAQMPLPGLWNTKGGRHPGELDEGGVPAEEEVDPTSP
jgi:putative transposase